MFIFICFGVSASEKFGVATFIIVRGFSRVYLYGLQCMAWVGLIIGKYAEYTHHNTTPQINALSHLPILQPLVCCMCDLPINLRSYARYKNPSLHQPGPGPGMRKSIYQVQNLDVICTDAAPPCMKAPRRLEDAGTYHISNIFTNTCL